MKSVTIYDDDAVYLARASSLAGLPDYEVLRSLIRQHLAPYEHAVTPALLTTAELATALRKSVKTVQAWKQSGKITPEVQTGHPVYDLESVKKQIAKAGKAKARARRQARTTSLPPGMVTTIPA